MIRRLAIAATLALATSAQGLIVFDNASSTDNTKNVIDPANASTYPNGNAAGVPWQYVARYGLNNASAVYIGNGFLLTARHVAVSNSDIVINGATYSRDTTFTPVPIVIPGSPNVVVDLQLQKIANPPNVSPLALAGPNTADTFQNSVLVGWGRGKGSVTTQGWTWGNDSTRALRWGTNMTNFPAQTVTYTNGISYSYVALSTAFNSNGGSDEATATLGDSGSALFRSFSGSWTLTGITAAIEASQGANTSSYNPADRTFFIRLRDYSWVLRYDHWKSRYGISNATPDDNDADGDGIPLLTEYALGLDPTIASQAGLPTASWESGSLALTFTRLASVTDIRVDVETSETLAVDSWTVEPATITVLDGSTVVQQVRATVPATTKKFARLRITRL